MAQFYCPWCGEPVEVRGDSWECGWCCDSGPVSALAGYREAQERYRAAREAQELEDDLKSLEWGVRLLVRGMRAAPGDITEAQIWRFVTHGMSLALCAAERRTERNLALLGAFVGRHPNCSTQEILAAAERGVPAFQEEFGLTEEELGSFWREKLPLLPRYGYARYSPDWLDCLLTGLDGIEDFFADEDSEDEAPDFEGIFVGYWQTYTLDHIDPEEAKIALSRWDDEGYPYAGRDLLLVTFPEAAGRWTVEELWRMYELHIMVETARFAPETVVTMLRLLLHTARDSLGNPEAAEVLLDEDMMALFENERVTAALLRALKEDDDFARLICQSNYVGYYHEELIKACNGAREPELRRRLLDLLAENPYGRAELEIEPYPEEPPVEELPPVVRKKAKLPQVAAGEQIYDYCMVRVKDSGRDLAYLTGGLSLQVGDWVEVPWGPHHLIRRGQVTSVERCLRDFAPWPPEHTKTVARIVPPP